MASVMPAASLLDLKFLPHRLYQSSALSQKV